jgi:hypothetical protein
MTEASSHTRVTEGRQREAVDEDPQPSEQRSVRRRRQRVAPVHGRPQRPLARHRTANAAGQQMKATDSPAAICAGEPRGTRAAAGSIASGIPVQRPADRDDRAGAVARAFETGAHLGRALDEQRTQSARASWRGQSRPGGPAARATAPATSSPAAEPSGARLVASTVTSGHPRISASATAAAATNTCSQL